MKRKVIMLCGLTAALLCFGCGKSKSSIWDQISNEKKNEIFNQTEENAGILDQIKDGTDAEKGQYASEEEEERIMEEEANAEQRGLIFQTDYEIEDYCDGHYIVSKNDGLLYGILDQYGMEWIPCKYDEITFLNRDEYVGHEDDKLFIKLKYEGSYTVMDGSGNTILSDISAENFEYMSYDIGERTEDTAAFIGVHYKTIQIFAGNGKELVKVSLDDPVLMSNASMLMCSDKWFLTYGEGTVYVHDMNGNLLKKWDSASCSPRAGIYGGVLKAEEGKAKFLIYKSQSQQEYYTIDREGNISYVETYTQDQLENLYMGNVRKNLGIETTDYSNEYMRLYQTNGTWKLENLDGTSKYDDRYYGLEARNNMFFLVNENNEVLVINRFGEKIVDYGWLERGEQWPNGMGYYYDLNGLKFSTSDCYMEDDGLCWVYEDQTVYYFPVMKE